MPSVRLLGGFQLQRSLGSPERIDAGESGFAAPSGAKTLIFQRFSEFGKGLFSTPILTQSLTHTHFESQIHSLDQ